MRARSLGAHVVLAAGYLLLAVLHTYPLVRHLDTHLPGEGLGDNVAFLWNGWWMRHALATSHAFFDCPAIEAPFGASLALHTHSALPAFLGATLLGPLPLVRAHNLLIIASLALNGLAAYALACAVTRARRGAAIAGALFVVAPSVAARLMGHFNLVVAWPMVLACAAFVVWRERPSWRGAVLVGATAALVPYGDYYYTLFYFVFVALYAATEFMSARLHLVPTRLGAVGWSVFALACLTLLLGVVIAWLPDASLRVGIGSLQLRTGTNALTVGWFLLWWAALLRYRPTLAVVWHPPSPSPRPHEVLLAAAVFGALVTPLALAVLTVWTSGDYVTETASLKSSPRGVDLATLAMGPPYGGVAGGVVRPAYDALGVDAMESSAWLGVAPLVLLVIALRGTTDARMAGRWLAIAACFAVWALGPYLYVLGYNTGLLLPQALARMLPILDNARIPGRAMTMVHVATMVAMAAGLSSRRLRALPTLGLLGLCAVALIESAAAPLSLVPLSRPGVYAHIVSSPTQGSVLTVPFGLRDGFGETGRLQHDALYGQTVHQRPLVGGFVARLPPGLVEWYERREPFRTLLIRSTPGGDAAIPDCAAAADGLRIANVAFVVVYSDAMTRSLDELVAALPLRRIGGDGQRQLFAVAPCVD